MVSSLMRKLIIARHGNTFDKDDTILRVGLRTDLPLSASGITQAQQLGKFLKINAPNISQAFCSELQRTAETARIALSYLDAPLKATPLSWLNEADYGIDDGQPEESVIKRLGQEAIDNFNEKNILPKDWSLNIKELKAQIAQLAQKLKNDEANSVYFLVTSNGIAKFFLSLLNEQQQLTEITSKKMRTGSISIFNSQNDEWHIECWGIRP